ncbi:hypothetical protein [Acrocarpospora catenulata]|uniref:hypothetical protein n=1 Tax=Acrocarpospora catenulata TaxID=2836182 RepID=UPI001BDAC0F6|nr:hypothetical protein [Acrocarpospora catenulata]
MTSPSAFAECLRTMARSRLDRVEPRDEGRNARIALALLDAACHVETLPADDPLLAEPPGMADVLALWPWGEPADLLHRLAGARLPG